MDPLEQFWDDLLSGEPNKIQSAFSSLDSDARQAVLRHLSRMAAEEGWHPLQKKSAQAALDVLTPGGLPV
jgi:hypothetical protein